MWPQLLIIWKFCFVAAEINGWIIIRVNKGVPQAENNNKAKSSKRVNYLCLNAFYVLSLDKMFQDIFYRTPFKGLGV